eukprot:484209_1
MYLKQNVRYFILLFVLILLLFFIQLKYGELEKSSHINNYQMLPYHPSINNNKSTKLYWTNLSVKKLISAKSTVNNTLNILIVFGTSGEIIKIAPILWEYDKHRSNKYQKLSIFCLFTFQHVDLINDILNKLNVSQFINFQLFLNETDNNIDYLSSITIKIITGISTILHDFKNIFDLILVQGDTTSAMATAMTTFYNMGSNENIYIGHIEAGLRTFNIYSPYPEEINRQFISKMATFHFAASTWNKINLIKNDNIAPNQIVVCGNTVIDSVKHIYNQKQFRNEFNNYLNISNININTDTYKYGLLYLFAIYKNENKQNLQIMIYNIFDSIYEILLSFQYLHFFHPIDTSQKYAYIIYQWIGQIQITHKEGKTVLNRFHFIKRLSPIIMPFLYESLSIIITDSIGIQEEVTVFNNNVTNYYIPILIIGDTGTSKIEFIESKQAILIEYNKNDIIKYASEILFKDNLSILNDYNPYGVGNAASIILSFINNNYLSIMSHKYNTQSLYPINSFYHKNIYKPLDGKQITGELLVIFTVYKRAYNLKAQLDSLFNSTIIPDVVVMFQNENHIEIDINEINETYFNTYHVNIYHFH